MVSDVESNEGDEIDTSFVVTFYPSVFGGTSVIKDAKTGTNISINVICKLYYLLIPYAECLYRCTVVFVSWFLLYCLAC